MATERFTLAEAARHLGRTERTIRSYCKSGILTVYRLPKDRRHYLDPAEVEELRVELEKGSSVAVSRAEFATLTGQVKRIRNTLDVVLRVLDARDAPLSMTKDYGEQLYVLCLEHIRQGQWTPEEIEPWTEIFLRMSEEDLGVIQSVTEDPKPWVPFLRLVTAMSASVAKSESYASSLRLQGLHRQLAESRRRLRASALIYAEVRGYTDPSLDKYREYEIPSSISDLRGGLLRRKGR